jgi:two-component system NtrC family sensor kinase
VVRNRRILVVDDNPAIHTDFRKILCTKTAASAEALADAAAALFGGGTPDCDKATFEVDSAFQGEEALKRVVGALEEGKPYAMTFLDVRMPPGWDGIETAARLWAVDPDLQVVLCTAYSDYSWDEVRARFGRSDQLLILKKPFDNIEALQLADALTEKWRLTRQARARLADLEDLVKIRTQELAQAQKLESIGQLAAGIAHEINTPTQYIGDHLYYLQEAVGDVLGILKRLVPAAGAKPSMSTAEISALLEAADVSSLIEQAPKSIRQALGGVQRISTIVLAMKEFSHPATERTLYDLNHAIASTITIASNEWKRVAELQSNFDPELPPVPVMPSAFNQVILNILVNAAHAIGARIVEMPQTQGIIRVSTLKLPEWAEIRIEDNGCGIPEKIRNRIFDPFFTTKPVGQGTGQGLAIAHDVIVHKHHGTIGVESVPEGGTTFILRVPLEPCAPGCGVSIHLPANRTRVIQ